MSVTLDTRKAHLTRVHGDITAIYTWMDDERCMVLAPTYRRNAPWYVVKESAAFKYDNPKYLARQCPIACEVLGIEPSTSNWARVATIINEGLSDLIRMPSMPIVAPVGIQYGALKLFADGHQIAEEAIINEREQGATYG